MAAPLHPPRYWVVIPAAGIGRRFGVGTPKQYALLAGRPVILHSLQRLLAPAAVAGLVVGIADNDRAWAALKFQHPRFLGSYTGGADRADTVLRGLQALAAHAHDNDWVLVHDAVRPCVHPDDIASLMRIAGDDHGGVLGVPVADTLKRVDADNRITATAPRAGLWRALTPQMFRLAPLREALTRARRDGIVATDEAAAMEHIGVSPRMVTGRADNIKITLTEDLALAELYLQQQHLAQ